MKHDRHSIPGADDITRVELPNGITILTRPNFNSPSIAMGGYLVIGSLLETDEKLGISGFTASGLMRGTTERDFQSLYDAIESAGASFGYNGATHTTGFSGKALAEDLDLLLEILTETLTKPAFPAKQVARLRAQLLTGLAIRAQDTGYMAGRTFDQIVYKDHPYSRPEDGNPETIQAITTDDLVNFHKQHYGPKGMVIALVGAVAPDLVVEKVTRALGAWKNPEQVEMPGLPEVGTLDGIVRESVTIPGKIQSDIILGSAGPIRKSDDFVPASIGNNILGQFGMMGRIGDSVREQAGLAYYAYSSMSGGIGPGPWSVSAGVNPSNIDQAVDLIREEIRKFVSEPVTLEELSDSKANFIGRLPLALESNAGVTAAILNLERYELGMDYYRSYTSMIEAVTAQQILETAQKYLHPDRLGIAAAGP